MTIDELGRTPLMIAAADGRDELARELLGHHAAIGAQDRQQRTRPLVRRLVRHCRHRCDPARRRR